MLPLGVRRRQPLVYSNDWPGLQQRLVADHAQALDLLDLAGARW
jgi:hypothetical protein